MNKLKNVTMKNSGQDPEVNNLMQRLVREGTLIAYSLLALFLLIALVSYSPTDPGFTTTGTGEDVVNAVGVYGAWLADIFWYLLGYLAFAFPVLLIYKVYTSFSETPLEAEFSWPLFGMKTG
ncbi:MAG: DNA translocase FtsK 4TM domain-containing protein, partial [Gammaproteobacteria bacterium]